MLQQESFHRNEAVDWIITEIGSLGSGFAMANFAVEDHCRKLKLEVSVSENPVTVDTDLIDRKEVKKAGSYWSSFVEIR